MQKLIRRVLLILPLAALQILWLVLLFSWLSPWRPVIDLILFILSVIFVLFLITEQAESSYRMLWLMVILTFPIPGALLYLVFGNKRSSRPLRKQLDAAPLPPEPFSTDALYEELGAENKRLAQTFRWIEDGMKMPVRKNTSAKYFPLGEDMFHEMLDDLRQAKRYIFLEYFILEDGAMWRAMEEILFQKAAEGVDVRLIYDDLGSLKTYTKAEAAQLRERGVRCLAFNRLVFIKGTLNYRDHRKMLIIDGDIAYSGGINIADEYINAIDRFGHWKDIGFKLRGEPVRNYLRMFVKFWDAFSGEPVPESYLTPSGTPGGVMPEDADGYVLSYYDSPLDDLAVSNELYIDLLSQASETAWFYTPYLMPGNGLLDAFVRAARRGVDVRIIMPGEPDKDLVYRMSRSFYAVLLGAGVKIYEYTPGFLHAKACIIDGVVGAIGTVNLDYRSLFLHFENNSLFYRASILDDLKADFLATQAKCMERTTENIQMTFGKWVFDGVLRIFSPLC